MGFLVYLLDDVRISVFSWVGSGTWPAYFIRGVGLCVCVRVSDRGEERRADLRI